MTHFRHTIHNPHHLIFDWYRNQQEMNFSWMCFNASDEASVISCLLCLLLCTLLSVFPMFSVLRVPFPVLSLSDNMSFPLVMLYPVHIPSTYTVMSCQSVQFVLSVSHHQNSLSAPQVRISPSYVTGHNIITSS